MSSGWGSALLEGYLDKQLKPFGKSKLWCSLQTSQFVTQKGPQKPGGGETYSLSNIQMVRKVSSDRSGHQFEIQVKNKTIIFSAGSPQDCEKWVETLHQALMSQRSHKRLMCSPASSGYEEIEIDESVPTFAHRSQSTSSASQVETGYAQIGDVAQPRQTVTKRNSQARTGGPEKEEEDPYASVLEEGCQTAVKPASAVSPVSEAGNTAAASSPDNTGSIQRMAEERNKEGELQRGYAVVNKTALQSTLKPKKAQLSSECKVEEEKGKEKEEEEAEKKKEEEGNKEEERNKEEELQRGYAVVNKKVLQSSLEPEKAELSSKCKVEEEKEKKEEEEEEKEEDVEVHAVQLRRPSQASIVQPNGEEEEEDVFGSSEDELDQWYEEAKPFISTNFPPIPTLHQLSDDDVAPFVHLKEFLHENPQLSRASYRINYSADPVADLRNLLAKLQ